MVNGHCKDMFDLSIYQDKEITVDLFRNVGKWIGYLICILRKQIRYRK